MLDCVSPCIRVAAIGLCLSFGLAAQSTPLLDILESELARNFEVLRAKADPAPYFIAYTVTDIHSYSLNASQGALLGGGESRSRLLDVTVRVGSRSLDNYHDMPGESPRFTTATLLSVDDDPNPIRRALWLETDRTYRLAAERLIKIRTNQKVAVAREESVGDFSEETPVKALVPSPPLRVNPAEWEGRLRRLSAEFSRFPGILSSSVTLSAQREMKSFVNTEGTKLHHGRGFARIYISARAKAPDGMDLSASDSFEALDPALLPKEEVLKAAVIRVAEKLEQLLRAPVVEPFVGPAILSGRASGVFFHEIFGHRIEGHRQKDESEGQTFAKSIGSPVLPDFLSVIFDPTRRKHGDIDLNGWYEFDDEGVKARRVPVVEQGILKTFLLSRSPLKDFPNSNGHGRKQPGAEVVARQSNLIVESAKTVTSQRLRQMLIEEIKRQGKPYGYYFEQVTGGVTNTGRRGVQAFKVVPVVVYRVYPDGRPDELVRGADIVGTPLASFSKILATSDQSEVFNGYCGAESGFVPVAAVSPAILVSELEVQKAETGQDRPPLLPRPSASGGGQ